MVDKSSFCSHCDQVNDYRGLERWGSLPRVEEPFPLLLPSLGADAVTMQNWRTMRFQTEKNILERLPF